MTSPRRPVDRPTSWRVRSAVLCIHRQTTWLIAIGALAGLGAAPTFAETLSTMASPAFPPAAVSSTTGPATVDPAPAPVLTTSSPPPAPPAPADPVGPPAPATSIPAAERFKRGRSLFEYRDCTGALAELGDLAVPGQLDDERDQLEVHRMLGICFALGDQRREAAREFSSLLSLDPDHELDPFEVPPPVIDAFDAQKAAMKVRLAEIRRARERAREDGVGDEGGVLVERVTTVRTSPWAASFLPLGLAQLNNGEPVKAAVVGAAQGLGLLVNVVGFWGSIVVQQGLKDGFTPDEVLAENALWYGQFVGLGLFGLSYAVGVADALWNREDQAVLADKQTKRPLTPSEMKKLRRIERAPPTGEPAQGSAPTTSAGTAEGARPVP